MAPHDRADAEKGWLRLFPDADYRLPMNLRQGDAASFWSRSADSEIVLAERRKWLETNPERHFVFLPESRVAAEEAVSWFSKQTGLFFADAHAAACGLEPDWVLLAGDAARFFPVVGGAVVFPSGWALEDKIGRPLAEVHAPVPGLEAVIGAQIATFLTRLAPGAPWERDNWGLSAQPALNHHPELHVPPLKTDATLQTTWLRLERQFLTRLPHTNAILFGIRVTNHRLDALVANFPACAARLARALQTMPEPLAAYKGLSAARDPLADQLRRLR